MKPWLGVHYTLIESNPSLPKFEIGAQITKTAQDFAIAKNGPAEKAGLKEEDILISVDGTLFTQGKALAELITPHHPGDRVKIQFVREGKIGETTVTLGDADQIQK